MEIRELVCIGCPAGCSLKVTLKNGKAFKVEGNTCRIGEQYGISECTNPKRIVTSTVIVEGGEERVVSVKTEKDIPKGKIFDVIEELKKVKMKAPVYIGDLVIKNISETGVNIIATKNNRKI
ncbi:MAG: DUF1667 domain-containing protein [Bacillota bacterium]|nr:DUF1667 domain-containing protein [Bacillota bacterium]